MNQLVSVARALFDKLRAADRFAEVTVDVEECTGIDPASLDDALAYFESRRDPLAHYACLLVAWRLGFLEQQKGVRASELHEKLAHLAYWYGCFETAGTCADIAMGGNPQHRPDEQVRFRLFLLIAKIYRGQGRYDEALSLYDRAMALGVSADDRLQIANVLMIAGKLSHNHLWRAGQYKQLVLFALSRLDAFIDSRPEDYGRLRRAQGYKAICMDSLAGVEFERWQNSRTFLNGNDGITGALAQLESAQRLAEESGRRNSGLRIRFRKAWIRFHQTDSNQERRAWVEEFARLIIELEDDLSEIRGWAIRHGEIAWMLMGIGAIDESMAFLDKAVRRSRQLSDWRMLARTHLFGARIAVKQGRMRSFFEMNMDSAHEALSQLGGPHPELVMAIHQEEARFFRADRNFRRGLLALEQVQVLLKTMEDRVLADYEQLATGDGLHSSLRRVLSPSERQELRIALLLDYQLVSTNLQRVLQDLRELAEDAAQGAAIEKQLDQIASYSGFIQHRLKNLLRMGSELAEDRASPQFAQGLGANYDLKARFLTYLRKWQTDTEAERDRLGSEADHSVRETAQLVRNTMFESLRSPDLTITVRPLEDGRRDDFKIWCSRPLLHQSLVCLLENAARKAVMKEGRQEVVVRVGTRRTSSGLAVGVIEVEDSGGLPDELAAALSAPRRQGGLFLVKRFFEPYDADFASRTTPDGMTLLQIFVPKGRHVEVEV